MSSEICHYLSIEKCDIPELRNLQKHRFEKSEFQGGSLLKFSFYRRSVGGFLGRDSAYVQMNYAKGSG